MDDGRTELFQGYRVQRHLTLGPTTADAVAAAARPVFLNQAGSCWS